MRLRSLGSLLFLAAVFASAESTRGDAPETSDPNGRLIAGFDQPGMFPSSVTATNIDITVDPNAELDDLLEDNQIVQFPSGGPITWTSSRYNGGDLAVSIGPADPGDARYLPPASFFENFQAMNDTGGAPINPAGVNELTTLAWRASYATGALWASPRQNLIDNEYLIPFTTTKVGPFYGVAYFTTGFGQGWGFRLEDGQFQNGGGSSSDLVMGHAGATIDPDLQIDLGLAEASFDVSAAYLPYEQGWKGAWVQAAADGEATFASSSDDVLPEMVNWTSGQADIALPGVDSASDGMLFVSPSNGSSNTLIAAAFPNGSGGWTAGVRRDFLSVDGVNLRPDLVMTSSNDFQFVYVPTAPAT